MWPFKKKKKNDTPKPKPKKYESRNGNQVNLAHLNHWGTDDDISRKTSEALSVPTAHRFDSSDENHTPSQNYDNSSSYSGSSYSSDSSFDSGSGGFD